MTRALVLGVTLALSRPCAAQADTDADAARVRFERAVQAYEAGHYAEALEEFREAQVLVGTRHRALRCRREGPGGARRLGFDCGRDDIVVRRSGTTMRAEGCGHSATYLLVASGWAQNDAVPRWTPAPDGDRTTAARVERVIDGVRGAAQVRGHA